MKTCTKCWKTKDESEFYKQQRGLVMGLMSHCKTCHLISRAAWKKKHPDKVREYARRSYHKDIEKGRAKASKWARNNREKVLETGRRSREKLREKRKITMRLRQYGLTDEAYRAMLQSQGNCCAICQKPFGPQKASLPHVDHDHNTGVVRGVLCGQCNVGLGALGDSLNRLLVVVDYLLKSQNQSAERIGNDS